MKIENASILDHAAVTTIVRVLENYGTGDCLTGT